MIEAANPEINVEDLMRRIREEVAQRKAQLSPAQTSVATLTATAGTAIASGARYAQAVVALNRIPENKGCIADKPEYNLTEFLGYHDGDFIRSAYRGILRREPDALGYEHYLHLLYIGQISKVEVLGRLRYSTEGKACAVPVRGLLKPFMLQTSCCIPILGTGLALAKSIIRLPTIVRNRVSFENYSLRQQREQVEQINALATQIERTIVQMQQSFNSLAQTVDTKADAAELTATTSLLLAELEQKAGVAQLEAYTAHTDEKLLSLIQALDTKADAVTVQQDNQDIKRQILDHKYNILDQQRRLALLLEEARKRLPEPISNKQIENMLTEEDHLLDAFYVSFEDQFRGTRADIKERITVYLPVILAAKAGTAKAPILDIGCGRGEWLELLKKHDLIGHGVDLNRVMVSQCQELELDVINADAIEYLRTLKTDSLGAVTGMHIIEHIPFKRLIALFDEVLRVLKPAGVAIFETPNPENLIVGACNFYYDPTHINPLPPEPMRFVMETRGFGSIEILRLHPNEESAMLREGSEQLKQIVNGLLFGAQDYALVAYKS
jgi:SAM-dependent methyltransferase